MGEVEAVLAAEEEELAEERAVDDQQQEQRRRRKKKKTNRKRKSDDVMLPEMSEGERRELRRKQRALNADIDQTTSMEDVSGARVVNNDLFAKVGHTREAVLDAENVDAISKKFVHHAEQLVQVSLYDVLC